MWIVRVALQRPYTFIVMAIIILLATPLAIMRTPVDVLPEIDIPVISVIWNYNGLSAQQMGNRITQTHERILTTTVNDIEHIALMQKTITAITGHDARFTGMASRIRPLPDYLTALIEALEDTGAYPVREDGGSTLYRGRGYGSRDIKERSMENVGGWTSSRNAGGGRRYSRY